MEEKSGERKREKMGSLEKEARGLGVGVGVEEEETEELGAGSLMAVEDSLLKVESFWRGVDEGGRDDLWTAAGGAIVVQRVSSLQARGVTSCLSFVRLVPSVPASLL